MNNNPHRGFYWLSRSWYADSSLSCLPEGVVDEILIGLFYEDGGTDGEFAIRWINIGNALPVPRLEAFDDAWGALASFDDLFAWMAKNDNEGASPEDVADALLSMGIKDDTLRRTNDRFDKDRFLAACKTK